MTENIWKWKRSREHTSFEEL